MVQNKDFRAKTAKRKPTRAEKVEINRAALFDAAVRVVGAKGYTNASVADVTREAGLAQGTFYRYFESRQDLFDKLLPYIADDLIGYLGREIRGAASVIEVEERSLVAALDYLARIPGFYRILNEAEYAAPEAFKAHFKKMTDHYVASLRRSKKNGDLDNYKASELKALSYMLMSIRSYLYLNVNSGENSPREVVGTYLKFLKEGLGR